MLRSSFRLQRPAMNPRWKLADLGEGVERNQFLAIAKRDRA
jgi:hypothetical protein